MGGIAKLRRVPNIPGFLSALVAVVCLAGPVTLVAGVAYDYTTMTNQPGGSSFSAGVRHQFTPPLSPWT